MAVRRRHGSREDAGDSGVASTGALPDRCRNNATHSASLRDSRLGQNDFSRRLNRSNVVSGTEPVARIVGVIAAIQGGRGPGRDGV